LRLASFSPRGFLHYLLIMLSLITVLLTDQVL
jgi:hypothetical protein